MALATVRQLLLFATLLVPLEILAPARAQRFFRRGWTTDLTWFALSPLLVGFGATILLALLGSTIGALLPERMRALLQAQPWAVQLAEILLVSEIGGYWVHRWSHRARWLWRFHAVHHSVEELDWLAAHRQHPLEAVWLLGVANLPVLVLGFSVEALWGFVLFQKLYTAFLHSNVRLGFGRFGWLLASPRFHHWHHDGDAPINGGRTHNFASFFPWLDVLWGTYRVPDGEFPARYGCDEPVGQTWLAQLAHPFRIAPATNCRIHRAPGSR
ncbi:MAG TPA: sterol desaturase family protein [Polyangia bacterium]|nr:sterol desaturase family protein [Polyangia bacterium]